MEEQQGEYHLTFKQIAVRILSVIICSIGASTCAFSISQQIIEAGLVMSSVIWFSGMFALVVGIAGYAVTCDTGKKKGYVPLAIALVLLLSIVLAVIEKSFLYDFQVVFIALAAFVVQGIVLIIYHFVLKSQDPYAL